MEQSDKGHIEVTARYLPSPDEFRRDFPGATPMATVRSDIMVFFKVKDRSGGRKTYIYYLSFEGRRVDDLNLSLEALVGKDRRVAHFQLLEQIQEG